MAPREAILQRVKDSGKHPECFMAGWRAGEEYHHIPDIKDSAIRKDRYRKRPEIRAMMKRVGVTNRDLAEFVGLAPSTVGAKLAGYQPMDSAEEELFMRAVTGSVDKNKNGKGSANG